MDQAKTTLSILLYLILQIRPFFMLSPVNFEAYREPPWFLAINMLLTRKINGI